MRNEREKKRDREKDDNMCFVLRGREGKRERKKDIVAFIVAVLLYKTRPVDARSPNVKENENEGK